MSCYEKWKSSVVCFVGVVGMFVQKILISHCLGWCKMNTKPKSNRTENTSLLVLLLSSCVQAKKREKYKHKML